MLPLLHLTFWPGVWEDTLGVGAFGKGVCGGVSLYPETKPWPIPGCRLRPLDVAFLRAVHEKVNIIPVIGKADALLPKETQALKQKVCVGTSDVWPHVKP